MKKRKSLAAGIGLLVCLIAAGCGEKTEDYTVGSADLEYYNIRSAREEVFQSWEENGENGVLLGVQYCQGELAQICQLYEGGTNSVCLRRADGSSEVLKEGDEELTRRWYIDREGGVYCWQRSLEFMEEEDAPYIQKLDGEGREVFRRQLGKGILLWDLCQMEDGSIVLLLQEGRGGEMKLEEMNPSTGALSERPGVNLGESAGAKYIAAGSRGVLVLDRGAPEGIKEVDMKDGGMLSAMSFSGTSYSLEDGPEGMEIMGFRMPEDKEAEILWADPVSGKCVRETLRLSKMDKTPIVLQTTMLMDGGWLQERVNEFNEGGSGYQVVIEYPPAEEMVEFGEKIAFQVRMGKGPDILYGTALSHVPDLAEKGGLEDLKPYMEKSGVREEDYYPYAFSCLRKGEEIYTFRLQGTPTFTCIQKELLGGREVSDIEGLLDALLDWEGETGAYFSSFPASRNALTLLSNDDYWRMIDWEKGECDFDGELFKKMLETAKKYGVTYEKAYTGNYPTGQLYPIEDISCSFYGYKTSAELEEMGLVSWEALFGEEAHPKIIHGTSYAMAINANSVQKEGAWEFIRYLMSEEVQSTLKSGDTRGNMTGYMTNKQAHKKWIEEEVARLQEGGVGCNPGRCEWLGDGELIQVEEDIIYTKEDITQERIDEYIDMLEHTTEMGLIEQKRVRAVSGIIDEEAEYYFEGAKSLEEVVDIINSRVGLYLGEQH